MLSKKVLQLAVVTLMSAAVFCLFPGCKKKYDVKPSDDNTQGGKYYLTGDVNGAPWKANLVGAIDTTHIMAIAGFVTHPAHDTSFMELMFADTVSINQVHNFNGQASGGLFSAAVYVVGPINNPHSVAYATINEDMAPQGTFTVTKVDRSANVVSGVFNAIEITDDGTSSVTVTNGRFNVPLSLTSAALRRSMGY